jgi:hypothetical protein
VDPRAVLDAVVKRNIHSFRRESNPSTPIIQPPLDHKTHRCLVTRVPTVDSQTSTILPNLINTQFSHSLTRIALGPLNSQRRILIDTAI